MDKNVLEQRFDEIYQRFYHNWWCYSQFMEVFEIKLFYDTVHQFARNFYESPDSLDFTEQNKLLELYEKEVEKYITSVKAEAHRRDEERGGSPTFEIHVEEISSEERLHMDVQRTAILDSDHEVHQGHTEIHSETGTEGGYWIVQVEDDPGYSGMRYIQAGNLLTIYDKEEQIIFDDIILPDTQAGWYPYKNSCPYGMGQQASCGMWVHWIQKGWHPDEWGKLFFAHNRAVLRKPPKTGP